MKSVESQFTELRNFYRDWLRESWSGPLIELANKAGIRGYILHEVWRGQRVPQEPTLLKLFPVLGTAPNVRSLLLDRLGEFRRLRAAPRLNRSQCRGGCGTVKARSYAEARRSYDPSTNTFLCRKCESRVKVTCPKCKKQRSLRRSRLKYHKTFREGKGGILYVDCARCVSQVAIRKAQRNLNIKAVAEVVGRQKAVALVDAAEQGDAEAAEEIKGLAWKYTSARGARPKRELSPLGVSSRRPGPKPSQAMGRVKAAQLSGTFGTCRLCGLLLYRSPSDSQPLFHGICFNTWMRQSGVSEFRAEKKRLRREGFLKVGEALEYPLPDPVHYHKPENLMRFYRYFMARAGGASPKDIAQVEDVTADNVRDGIDVLISLLPGSWEVVFGARRWRSANGRRQELYPLPSAKSSKGREPLAQRLFEVGMSISNISDLTGLEVDDMYKRIDHRSSLGPPRPRPRSKLKVHNGMVVKAAKLGPLFCRCPLCGLVKYPRRGRKTNWHQPCWRIRGDHPLPQDSPTSFETYPGDQILTDYRCLFMDAAGVAPYEIAAYWGITQPEVQAGIDRILALLPGSWELVFPHTTPESKVIRQQLVPLPERLRPKGRKDLTKRLAHYGMPVSDVSRVTGYSMDRVNAILATVLVPVSG